MIFLRIVILNEGKNPAKILRFFGHSCSLRMTQRDETSIFRLFKKGRNAYDKYSGIIRQFSI